MLVFVQIADVNGCKTERGWQ